MKAKILCLLFYLLYTVNTMLFGQSTFQKIYSTPGGGYGIAGCSTADGNYIFAGTGSTPGLEGVFLVKINLSGDTLWTFKYELGPLYWTPRSIKETADKKLVIYGYCKVDPAGYFDTFCMSVDSLGNLLWMKQISRQLDDFGYEVIVTPDSGYILLGASLGGNGFMGGFMIKIDSLGNLVWNKLYTHADKLYPFSIQPTTDNGYIVCGEWRQMGGFPEKIHLFKTDSAGNEIWSYSYGNGTATNVRQTADGGFILAGFNYAANNERQVVLIKTDASGIPSWEKGYSSPLAVYSHYLEVTNDSGYCLVGGKGSLGGRDYFMIKTNMVGDTLWTRHYGTPADEEAYYIHQTTDNGYIMGGCSNQSIYVVKTDSLGYSGCNSVSLPFNVHSIPVAPAPAPVITWFSTWNATNPLPSVHSDATVASLCSSVGEVEAPKSKPLFSISPNPTTGNFTIQSNYPVQQGKIVIFDALGQTVLEENDFNGLFHEIDLEGIASGIYFVKFMDAGNHYCEKLIVEEY